MKFNLYQMLPRLWGEGRFADVDAPTLDYLKTMGIEALWLTGIIRHESGKPFVKGNPGSPYSICDYYDVNPYLSKEPESRMEEFSAMVRRIHSHGLKMILDFVPNHVSPLYSDSHGGIPLLGWHDYDWTDTLKINYAAPSTFERMTDIVRYWASLGADGFRCDMVELVPTTFFAHMIPTVKAEYPDLIFIGEAYDRSNYRGLLDAGFDYLYDKSGLYDSLYALVRGSQQDARGEWNSSPWTARSLTWNWQSLGNDAPRMLSFLENHDEVRFASSAFAGSVECHGAPAASRFTPAPLACAALLSDGPFMLYFGQEVGEDAFGHDNNRTSIFDFETPVAIRMLWEYIHNPHIALSTDQAELLALYRSILNLACGLDGTPMFDLCYCQSEESGFDPRRHFAFLRGGTLVFCNFSLSEVNLDLEIPPAATALNEVKENPVRVTCRAFGAYIKQLITS